MSRQLFTAFSIAVAPLLAQTFEPLRQPDAFLALPFDKSPVPPEILVSGGVAIADVDGDGRGDVLVGSLLASSATATGLRYYRSRGDGTFEDRSMSHIVGSPIGIDRFTTADLDGDGDVDLASTYCILRNVQGVLVRELLPSTTSSPISVAAGDVDGDGDVDLFSGVGFGGGPPRQDRLLLNQGNGTFVYAPVGVLPVDNDDTAAVRLVDVDGDGDLDAVLAIEESGFGTGGARLYLNDGTGTFVNASSGLPVPQQDATSLAIADFDGDGDPDVVVGVGGGLSGASLPDLFLRNVGTAQFVAVPGTLPAVLAPTSDVQAADLDADGDADLLLAQGGSLSHGQPRVYRNDGAAFVDVTATWLAREEHRGGIWAAGDFGGDAAVDAVFVGGGSPGLEEGRVRLHLGRVGATFLDLNPPRCPNEAWTGTPPAGDTEFVDVDGDGDLDWFTARSLGGGPFGSMRQAVLRNDGQARFALATGSLPPGIDVVKARCADVDGDGDPDLLLATAGGVVQWRNDGAGNFAPAPPGAMPTTLTSLNDLCVGDVDGDGDVDVFAGRGGLSTFDELLRNDGSGVFTRDPNALPTHTNGGVKTSVLLDHDGDGDLDLVLAFGNSFATGTLHLYHNVGAGQFQATTGVVPAVPNVTRVEAFDADVDGDLDLLVTQFSDMLLLLDQGTTFVQAQPPGLGAVLAGARDPNLADVDGDGDTDLVVSLDSDWRWLRNDGGFVYRLMPGVLADTYSPRCIAGADLDGDGDADFVLHETYRPPAVMLGRAQQLHAPRVARLGQRYDLELHFLEDHVGRPDTVMFALAFARLTPAVVVPTLGALHVDPAGAVFGVGSVVPPADEVRPASLRCSFVLPTSPALLGGAVYSQALPFGGTRAKLSNFVADVLH